jgi:hypothetical protein
MVRGEGSGGGGHHRRSRGGCWRCFVLGGAADTFFCRVRELLLLLLLLFDVRWSAGQSVYQWIQVRVRTRTSKWKEGF